MGEMKVLFWDLDHTLWDFKKNSREALREGYEAFDLRNLGVGEVEEYISAYETSNDWCWREYREGRMEKSELRGRRFEMAMEPWGLQNDAVLGGKLGQHYIDTSPYKTNLFEGSIEVLTALKEAGFRMVILTNGFEEVQHIKVEKSGLSDFFESVITSDEMGYKKPHPAAFRIALEMVGVESSDVVMIGDNIEADIEGGKKAGLETVFFNPDSKEINESYKASVDHEISSLVEILDIVLH